MLAVSPLRTNNNEREGEIESFSIGSDDFSDFSGGNLLDNIDFDDLFVGINNGDVLPDLEMDPEILAEISVGRGEESEMNTSSVLVQKLEDNSRKEEEDKFSGSGNSLGSSLIQGEEIVSKKGESDAVNASTKEADKGRKSSTQSKNKADAKRKVKVDWTPELHRRFVQAVEQLGVDKAVPSRILEIMGIDCLTRHNIASHLQKYRSHRKHLLAREAEAASWSQRRQLYSAANAGGGKRDMHPWVAPTMGFPHLTPMHHFRPLHVWGHPSVDQSLVHVWPKHLPHSPSPPPPPAAWAPPPTGHPPPPPDPSFWHAHHQRVNPSSNPIHLPPAPPGSLPLSSLTFRVPLVKNSLTPGMPCFPPQMAPTRFPNPPVPGIPSPHPIYRLEPGIGVPTAPNGQAWPQPPFDFHPSNESVDAAIGDALSKPWLPLPLGLKPPSIDGVLGELQRQGISNIPPTFA